MTIANMATQADLDELHSKPKQSKYRNVRTERGFDSKWEEELYDRFALEEQLGIISGLQRQVRYKLEVNGILVCTYIADIVFVRDGQTVIVDAKGGKSTPIFVIKKKLMFALYGILVTEVRRERR